VIKKETASAISREKSATVERNSRKKKGGFDHILNAFVAPRVQLSVESRRLTVAYMSSDFGGHAVGSLLRGLLREHDHVNVKVIAVCMYVCMHVWICVCTYI
jgi:predicted O-linked N-acetylglucosamine transferase (SPINDLY family)